jgi:hypothetical protein
MADADQNTPVDGDEWGTTLPSASPSAEPVPPGPDPAGAEVWGGDTWDSGADPDVTVAYEGRRRAQAPPTRLTVVIGLAIVALAVAIAIPLLLSGGSDTPAPPAAGPAITKSEFTDFTEFINPTGGGGQPTSASGPSAAPRTTTTRATTTTTTANPPAPPPPPFATISVEAEAGGSAVTLGGSAHSEPYAGASGGRIVFNIGNWGMQGGAGTVTFRNISIPNTATYVLTFQYVHPDGDRSRSATITVSGVTPVTLTFAGDEACCHTRAVSLTIPAGVHTVTMGNTSGEAPALDKLTITRP